MKAGAASLAAVAALACAGLSPAWAASCDKPVYLTFDTGHMGVAPLVADLARRYDAKLTFFIAREPTLDGGDTLDEQWAPWWRARVAEGHDFGSHTWAHDSWLADLPDGRFRVRTAAGKERGTIRELSADEYCAELRKPADWFKTTTGQAMAPIFRAPGGRTSPALLAAAQACGFKHVGWSAAGFLGDELPSDRFPNDKLLAKALRDIRPGDILMAHLGIWSRVDAWAPAVLEPLMRGLKERGYCFAPLREHPAYAAAMRRGEQPAPAR